jgi:hypothetical protein
MVCFDNISQLQYQVGGGGGAIFLPYKVYYLSQRLHEAEHYATLVWSK